MHFWIDIKFTKILGQFKRKKIFRPIHDMQFQVIFYPLNFYLFFNTLLNKLQDLFICNIWINLKKKTHVKVWIS
jgi:hypothetical protein